MRTKANQVAIRWTIGDVTSFGFEALRLSCWGAWRLFGPDAAYVICLNSIPLAEALARTGTIPRAVECVENSSMLPPFLRDHADETMAEGVGWKLAPVRLFPDCWEVSLDNDVILWAFPAGLRRFLEDQHSGASVIAEDVKPCFGKFAPLCARAPRNSGIRGLSPGFDYEHALRSVLEEKNECLTSELDEQGMQVAALQRHTRTEVVSTEEVTICSPFHPHQPHLGSCGAHFVGLNTRHLPWSYYGRPADRCKAEHWLRLKPAVEERVLAGAAI